MKNNFLEWCKTRFSNRTDSEHSQAMLREIIVILGTIYGGYLYSIDSSAKWAFYILLSSNVLSLGIIAHILYKPQANPKRRIIGALHDNIFTTMILWCVGPKGALYFFVFPFITVGNGFRFGVRYLAFSGILGIVGVASFVFFSDIWKGQLIVGSGVILSNILVTIYTGILLNQLQKTKLKLETMATHDALTGLANRHLFMEKLAAAIAISRHEKWNFACMYFDLDGFKAVNDRYGHKVGDALLRAVADAVKGCIRKTDLLARLGGDEFTIILESLSDRAAATRIATNIIKAIESIKAVEGFDVKVSASLGIAFVSEEGYRTQLPVDGLVKEADEAMYRAKKSGKGRFEFVDFCQKSKPLKAA